MMLGATIGDIVGSRFEFFNHKSTDFELFTSHSNFTDDTICTVAVAEWVLGGCQDDLVPIMQKWCRRYPNPDGAYGMKFNQWIHQDHPKPYRSWGNGSAMRVSAVGWAFDDLDNVITHAYDSAVITHNHPEGIKGAQATACAIFWARTGQDKAFIRDNITQLFDYDLSQTCDDIREDYRFNESCQGTVPPAIIAFLDSDSFEHAIRLAVSLGGDSDTLTAITGSIAEAYYRDIPPEMVANALAILPEEMQTILAQINR